MRHTRSGDVPAIRIEPETGWAWCGDQRLDLTPKTFAVLRHLVERPNHLVTKDELLVAAWGDIVVSDAAITSCIRDLRKALGDSSRAPRYIETVHRRGFRFIGPIALAATAPLQGSSMPLPGSSTLVGRDAELARLRDRWDRARGRQRQLVFVTGEPGMGKTALVEAFLAEIGAGEALRIGRGQCVEQYGPGEAYLPVLEALGRLGREAGSEQLVEVLQHYAPTWLAELPALLSDRDLEVVRRRAQGTTRDRMLRELVEAIEVLSGDTPLVLVLEDLHWSDSATVDLLGMLARRRDPARLLMLGTYRPADVAGSSHPLKPMTQELQLHGHCEEIPLEFLSVTAVGEYLSRRFPRHRLPPDLAVIVHRHTDGNPLFVVNTIDYLITRGQMREVDGQWELSAPVETIGLGTPETLSQIVEKHLERLTPDEQAILAVASVAGAEFSVAVVAADGIDPLDGERLCQGLALRKRFLRATGLAEWPDGTIAGRYAFIHALYRHVLSERVSIGHRVGLHLRIGALLERSYGQRAGEIAGELAMHFEHGRDVERAVQYHRQAGAHALRRHGYREAAEHATRALNVLRVLPDSSERIERELELHGVLGAALTATKGFADPEVVRTYARARELCEHVADPVRLVPALLGLGRFHHIRGDVHIACDLATRLLTTAETTHDTAVRLAARSALGILSFYAGEFEAALTHLEQGLALYDPQQHSPNRSAAFQLWQDPGVSCAVYAGWTLHMLGYPARGAARIQEALTLARSSGHWFSVAYACHFAAEFHQCRRERKAVQELEDEALAHSTEHDFRPFLMVGGMHRGWLLAEDARAAEGLTTMQQAQAASLAIGIEVRPAYLALLAEVYERMKRSGEGLSAIGEALAGAERTGQHYWDAELHRLKGTLTLQAGPAAVARRTAESCFRVGLDIARRQRAKSFELRAAMSLGRLWQQQRKIESARTLLSGVYDWFTEGFDTPDLIDAKALLEELGAPTNRRSAPLAVS